MINLSSAVLSVRPLRLCAKIYAFSLAAFLWECIESTVDVCAFYWKRVNGSMIECPRKQFVPIRVRCPIRQDSRGAEWT